MRLDYKTIHKPHSIVFVTATFSKLYNCIVFIRPIDIHNCRYCHGCCEDKCIAELRPDKQNVVHIKLRQY